MDAELSQPDPNKHDNWRRRLFWSTYAAAYDSVWDTRLTAEVAAVTCEFVPSGLPVLDVGAGTGLITAQLSARGYSVMACEPQQRMAQRFRRRLPHVPLSEGRWEALSVGIAPRGVVATNVVHLAGDPRAAIAALRVAAAPGGVVVVVAPCPKATLQSVSRAMKAAGDRRRDRVRFVALHAILAPLTRLARTGLVPMPAGWTDGASAVHVVRDVQIVAQFPGLVP